jgi:ATP-dependent RNA helicase DDX21
MSKPFFPFPKYLQVGFVVLDEADQMLNVGFEQDVETILENVPTQRQTMLFSATVPKWVRKLVKQYLNDPVDVDLVGEGQTGKMADSITALAVQITDACRRSVLVDVLTVHRDGGKAIVFTQTKRDCDEVAAAVALHMPCEPLHGDMAQSERERVLAGFRAGRTSVLVATDVAARGLDIPDVDLVVHYELPRDPEAFLHRSGRTGRAGRNGTAIAMYSQKEIGYFKRILRETETTNVTVVPVPGPREVVEAAAKEVMYRLDGVDDEVREYFAPVAKTVLASKDPQAALEAALAALSGIKSIPEPRSLLTMQEGFVTLQIMSSPGRIVKPGNVAAVVSKLLGDSSKGSEIGRIRLMDDKVTGNQGAAFDVPKVLAEEILAASEELQRRGVSISKPTSLPPEEGLYDPPPRRSGERFRDDGRNSFNRRGGSRGGGGRGGGGSRDYSRDGRRGYNNDRGRSRGQYGQFGGDKGKRFDRNDRGWDFGGERRAPRGGQGRSFGQDEW